MKLTITNSALLVFVWSAAVFSSVARSDEPVALQSLCATNPNCQQEMPDATGAVLFRIHITGSVVSVRCNGAGECRRMYPRGSSAPITDLIALFAVK
jgi:hypothetical protein